MKAKVLYQQLEKDFIKPGLSDEWAKYMNSVADFLCDNFKKRSMGLVCDFAIEITKVYTAVFPSRPVMKRILKEGTRNAMLFVHHPSIWDIRKAPEVFQQMEVELLKQFKKRKISIYNLHVPLDNFGEYSTAVSLAHELNIEPQKPFAHYYGSLSGIFGKTKLSTVQELRKKLESVIGHRASLYPYGGARIKDGVVAIIAGGGNSIELLKEVAEEGVNTFVTGISVKNDHSKKAHEFAEKNKINILGGTHYSTEQFACIALCDYFKRLGLPCKFIRDKPVLADL